MSEFPISPRCESSAERKTEKRCAELFLLTEKARGVEVPVRWNDAPSLTNFLR